MAGRVHVIHGDLTLLDCDVAVIPTDRLLRIEPSWHDLITEDEAAAAAPDGWQGGAGSRSFAVAARDDEAPRRVLLEVATEGTEPVEWYVDGLREALDGSLGEPQHPPRRCRPLVALPLVGTRLGGSAGRRGDLIAPMLELLSNTVQQRDLDIALVTFDRSDYAAVQAVRDRDGTLPEPYEEHAQRIAELAVHRELVPFLGAGVSAAAGLPAWWDLLERVAETGDLLDELSAGDGNRREELRTALRRLGTLDAAELLRGILGREAVDVVIREVDAQRHSLAHGLLASLGARRAITTNYDRLYELACQRPLVDRGGLAVLPWDGPDPGRSWLVKMHGDVERPDSIVLSRGDLAGYELTRKPLTSLLQAQMLTGHLLFVGSSMTDDAVVQLAWEIRELFRAWDAPPRLVGTVIGVHDDPLRARLWKDVLTFVPLEGLVDDGTARATGLATFLDRVALLASRDRSYLLDPRYEGMVPDDLQPLRQALTGVADAVDAVQDDADAAVTGRAANLLHAFGWDAG